MLRLLVGAGCRWLSQNRVVPWWAGPGSGPAERDRAGGRGSEAADESLQKPAKEPVERHNAMALDQSALLEVLDALKVADVGDRVRQAAETVYQGLRHAGGRA